MTDIEFAEKLKERIKGRVRFVYFTADQLVYTCWDGFNFPVPVEDTRNVQGSPPVFKAEDKGIYYMRWIRQHMERGENATVTGADREFAKLLGSIPLRDLQRKLEQLRQLAEPSEAQQRQTALIEIEIERRKEGPDAPR